VFLHPKSLWQATKAATVLPFKAPCCRVDCLSACTAAILAEETTLSYTGAGSCFCDVWFVLFVLFHDTSCRKTRINSKVAALADACQFSVRTHGDSAYPLLSNTAKGGGYAMSASRICVEWGFGKVCNLWAGIDYDRKMQLYHNAPGLCFVVCLICVDDKRCR
jgi:hypothetical protein